jgi:molybdenum cofactor cytidylyltransferase
LKEELRDLGVLEAMHQHWESGMGSSVRVGVEAVVKADARVAAVVLMLCDQPFVTWEVVDRLVAKYRQTGRPIVASQYGGSFGVPTLFDKSILEELARLEDGEGAKQIIHRHLPEVHLLPFPGGEIDVDTPEDFARLLLTDG